ncbi:MAG: lytic murein transglycosylase B [Pseudomonadota bacterium]
MNGFHRRVLSIAAGAVLAFASAAPAIGATADKPFESRDGFAARMHTEHGLDEAWVTELLGQAKRKQSILDAISRPAERVKPWHEYRKIFLNEKRIAGGVAFWREHRETLDRVSAEAGVDARIIVAILGIETLYGERTGSYRVLDALSTLAFDYPPRSKFFTSELEQFLLLSREESVDPLSATGSYAGAMGAPQFISSSYRAYAVDSSGDGKRDLWNSWEDVIGSVANYLRVHGWEYRAPVAVLADTDGAPPSNLVSNKLKINHDAGTLRAAGVGVDPRIPDKAETMLFDVEAKDGLEYWVGFGNFYAITRYNRSRMYALAAHQLADEIAARVSDD